LELKAKSARIITNETQAAVIKMYPKKEALPKEFVVVSIKDLVPPNWETL